MSPDEHLAAVSAAEAVGQPIDFLFFWGHQPRPDGTIGSGCLSQWWPAPFTENGITYLTAEHWMMAGKARLFDDEKGLAAVLAAASPKDAKAQAGQSAATTTRPGRPRASTWSSPATWPSSGRTPI